MAKRRSSLAPPLPSVVWSSPLFDPSGYADEARNFLLGLTDIGIRPHANPITWSPRQVDLSPGEAQKLQQLTQTRVDPGYLHVQHVFPGAYRRDPSASASIGRTMYETDRIPTEWVAHCNTMDQVWVPSDFNLETFSRSGVDPARLRKLPGALDGSRFRRPIQPLVLDAAPGFRFLSLFDWSLRKGWDILVRAYVEEFSADEDVTLVLKVSSSYGVEDRQLAARLETYLRDKLRLGERPLPRISLLGGTLSEDDLLSLYGAVNAFVMPSRGEGWGRPLMDAMAMGLPTIGTNWSGNTEFMTVQNSYLADYALVDVPPEALAEAPLMAGHRWAEPSIEHVRFLMRQVFTDQKGARQRGQRARKDVLAHYDRPVVARILRDHLREISQPVAVNWQGSQFVYHSLAHINREIVSQLIGQPDLRVAVVPYEPHQFEAGDDARWQAIEHRLTLDPSPAAVHVRHQWPPLFQAPAAGAWVMIQPWEFGGLPMEWIAPMRDEVDEIWVPTNWVRECYIHSGIPAEKVVVIPNGVDVERYQPGGPTYRLQTHKHFKFLFVGGTILRKGIDILLESYLATFTAADDVCLVIKANTDAYRTSSITALLDQAAALPNAPQIEQITTALTDDEMAALYRTCDALVHPFRGEGFGMPIAEAMASGLPAIVTGYGPVLDFCDQESAFLLPYRQVAIPQNDLPAVGPLAYWLVEPDRQALGTTMRRVVDEPELARAVGRRARVRIADQFTWQRVGGLVRERVRRLAHRTPLRLMPVAPLPLAGRRAVAFLHHATWGSAGSADVFASYGRTFTAADDVTLVVWLDPRQGVAPQRAAEYIDAAMLEAGVEPGTGPDLLLVTEALEPPGLRRLYAAVDWVVGSPGPLRRPVLRDLSARSWRHAATGVA